MSAFNPRLDGTPESEWREWLSAAPSWIPNTETIVVVGPHPDDECLGAAGLMYWARAQGRRVIVISVTDGEAANPQERELAQMRRAELSAALTLLDCGRSDIRVERLAFEDGQVWKHEASLCDAITSLLPAAATVIAPYELDGHPDHDCTGRASLLAAQRLSLPIVRYPIWAWHHLQPVSFGVSTLVKFQLDAAARRTKVRALECFRTQIDRSPDAIVPPHVLAYFLRDFETFIQ